MIDTKERGYLDYQTVKKYIDSHGLEFEISDWSSLVFRAKSIHSINPKVEVITFIEFHDLIYPITFFEILSHKELDQWINYLDSAEVELQSAG